MRIVILGAGQVGSNLAENLQSENNDVTIVDIDQNKIDDLVKRLDINGVCGYSSHPDVMERAGMEDADLLIAVTNSDESNMLACKIAHTLYKTPKRIARVRAISYLDNEEKLFDKKSLAIDKLISPEKLVTDYIHRLIEFPGALQVLDFAEGKVRLVAVRVKQGGLLVGNEIQTIRKHIPNIDTRIAAVYRKGKAIPPLSDTVIEIGDEVFFIVDQKYTQDVMAEVRKKDQPNRRIMIAGGGNIGRSLALTLEKKYDVRLIERNYDATTRLSAELNEVLVLLGDASDEKLLQEENIAEMDVFIALTNDDEANIMSSLLAKRLGAKKVMTLINRQSYVELVENSEIDIAISPQQATIGTLLALVRNVEMAMVHSLRKGAAEAIEAVAKGNSQTSNLVGRKINEINLPEGATIAALVRDEKVIITHHDTQIEENDHVILFLIDKTKINEVYQLFRVGVLY